MNNGNFEQYLVLTCSANKFANYFEIRHTQSRRYLTCDNAGNLGTAGGFNNGSG